MCSEFFGGPGLTNEKHMGRKHILEKGDVFLFGFFPWENHWAGQELTALGLEM